MQIQEILESDSPHNLLSPVRNVDAPATVTETEGGPEVTVHQLRSQNLSVHYQDSEGNDRPSVTHTCRAQIVSNHRKAPLQVPGLVIFLIPESFFSLGHKK